MQTHRFLLQSNPHSSARNWIPSCTEIHMIDLLFLMLLGLYVYVAINVVESYFCTRIHVRDTARLYRAARLVHIDSIRNFLEYHCHSDPIGHNTLAYIYACHTLGLDRSTLAWAPKSV